MLSPSQSISASLVNYVGQKYFWLCFSCTMGCATVHRAFELTDLGVQADDQFVAYIATLKAQRVRDTMPLSHPCHVPPLPRGSRKNRLPILEATPTRGCAIEALPEDLGYHWYQRGIRVMRLVPLLKVDMATFLNITSDVAGTFLIMPLRSLSREIEVGRAPTASTANEHRIRLVSARYCAPPST